jgi:hypothetical protein
MLLVVTGLALSEHATRPCACANLAVHRKVISRVEARRACRHQVKWPARVRSVAESMWHAGQVVNLSVTGVLMHTDQIYDIGERVEVEIDFLTQAESKTVVTGVGYVVRETGGNPHVAAIHFDLGCAPKSELV